MPGQRVIRRIVAAILVVVTMAFATPAVAGDVTGLWAIKAGDVTLMRIEVTRTADGVTGAWIRPAHFDSDFTDYWNVEGPPTRKVADKGRVIDGGVELTFDDPRPHAIPDVFAIRLVDDGHAEMRYVGIELEPFTLVRESADAPFGPWDKARHYTRSFDYPTNAEMTAIFDADQGARSDVAHIDWSKVSAEDNARRARTQVLLDSGALNSGDDYYHAAFVFQHGGMPEDYLKAHVLAITAAARGKRSATWIAAATLDRYLQAIGKPQVFGTQFTRRGDAATTQEPYDRALLSNAMRAAAGVPSQAAQEVRRQRLDESTKGQPRK